ncbi:hypothetical protein KHA80_06215 [Anaerobacillus sp. HL2]|nr:hypothetical protein KHA80_06215 [Anaerobacillus sp. HL2]
MISSYINVIDEKIDDEKLSAELNFYKQLNEKLNYLQQKLSNQEIFQELSTTRKKRIVSRSHTSCNCHTTSYKDCI